MNLLALVRRHPRLSVTVAVTVTAVVALVVVLLPRSGGSQQLVVLDGPTPTPTQEPAPTPTMTLSPTPSAEPSTTAGPGEAPAPSPVAAEPVASAELLLPDSWWATTFGAARPMSTRVIREACDVSASTQSGRFVAASWSWPDETLVEEWLVTGDAQRDAIEAYGNCETEGRMPTQEGVSVRIRDLDLGDKAVIIRIETAPQVKTLAFARIGRSVVGLTWLQSGRPDSDAPLESSLRAAVRAFLGELVPTPEAAPVTSPDSRVVGYLRGQDLGLNWREDAASVNSIGCSSGVNGYPDSFLTTAQPAVWRTLTATSTWRFARAAAADPGKAADEFAACRATYPDSATLADVGDEAFCATVGGLTPEAHDIDALRCYARVGGTYYAAETSQADLGRTTMAQALRTAITRTPS